MQSFKGYITEMPMMIPEFKTIMDNYDENIIQGGKFLRRCKEVFEETDVSILFRTGIGHDGYIVLLDKRTNYVNYFARFEYVKLDGTKHVTQIGVWTSDEMTLDPAIYNGIATRVFFDILLKRFKTIASEQEQTQDGKRFCVKRMANAIVRNHKVGLLKVGTKTIEYYDHSTFKTIGDWIASLEVTWGPDPRHKRYRFIIED